MPCEYVTAPRPEDNDAVLARLSPGALVINATGLGKDAPGSPLTDAARFPEAAVAWDLNHRGRLVFLDQARAQRAARGPAFDEICRIAAAAGKPAPPRRSHPTEGLTIYLDKFRLDGKLAVVTRWPPNGARAACASTRSRRATTAPT